MNEYDEVALTDDAPDWHLRAGSRGVVVDVVDGEDFVTVEFYEQDGEIAVHLVPLSMLRVTDPYRAPAVASPETAHP